MRAALAGAYDLIVFPGHHEYVTTREYDLIEGYRNLGGNLMFLSANNFFWQVVRRGQAVTKTKLWRDLGRPEAALIGVQYHANGKAPRRPWIVRRSSGGLVALRRNRPRRGITDRVAAVSRSMRSRLPRPAASRCSRRSPISSGRG